LRALIRRMSLENTLWGAPHIHGELLKLGFTVAQSTVAKYMAKKGDDPSGQSCIDWLVARAVVDSGSACARHARTVARDFGQKNGRCARGATPRPARRSQRKPYELRGKRVTSATRCVNWRWLNGLDESAGCRVISHLV
jgi:hypothetical protein